MKTNKSIVEIPFSIRVSDGLWHTIEIGFNPLLLKLDKKVLAMQKNQEDIENKTISTNGVFYIGGVPSNTRLINKTNGLFSQAFDGCIQSFGINTDITSDFNQYESVNIHACKVPLSEF